jgi:hypothetical protein
MERFPTFFFNPENRDLMITGTSTLVGGIIGVLASIGLPPSSMDFFCGSAYGAYAGMGLSLAYRLGYPLLSRMLNRANETELLLDESDKDYAYTG